MNTFNSELEAITRSEKLFTASQDEIIEEIGMRMTACLKVERINIWMFNDVEECMECIGNYHQTTHTYSKGEVLCMVDMPHYYSSLKSARVLLIEDVLERAPLQEKLERYTVSQTESPP